MKMTNEKITKKSTPKKAKKVVEAVEETQEEVVEEITKPSTRKKKVEIERNEMIACRSTTEGRLIYISPRTREKIVWNDFGSVQYIEMGELLTMKASRPTFLENMRFVIDDEEASQYLGLDKMYEKVFEIEDIKEFLNQDYDKLANSLPKLPDGLRDSVASKAREMVEDGSLDSRRKMQLIESVLKIDLFIFDK